MTPDPSKITELHRQAERALSKGRLREAHQCCLQILEADRSHADAWFICGVIAGRNRNFDKAVEILRNAVMLDAQRADYLAELGKYLLALDLPGEALAFAKEGLALAPKDLPTLNTLGGVFSHCGDHEHAMQCFGQAIASLEAGKKPAQHSPANLARLYFNMAVSLQFVGEIDRAEDAFEQAIALRPTYFKAHSALSTLRKQTPQSNHVARLESLRDKTESAADQLHLGHALARELEDLGQYGDSLEHLAWAKASRAAEAGYDLDRELSLLLEIQSAYSAGRFDTPAGNRCDSNEPIFIVGMPRTGTTLVEQILGSHSTVFAAGELQQFPQLTRRQCAQQASLTSELEVVIAAAGIDTSRMGQSYLDSTRPLTGHSPHFTDKLPRNYLYLGLIHLALPNAKIICLRRDPMDTCLSNYRQLFAVNARHYQYNLDLMHCGRYFIAFDQLMKHWTSVLPGRIHEVSYESLVKNPEQEIRNLLEFCALPWEAACLSFNERDNAVATPSALQVKQGMYTSSMQRWKKYGEAVQPLYELLSDAGFYN